MIDNLFLYSMNVRKDNFATGIHVLITSICLLSITQQTSARKLDKFEVNGV
jgi:hypothetical protein